MSGEVYGDILEKNLFESIKKVEEWVMQQDNDPKHRAHIVTHWLKEKEIELIKRLRIWIPSSICETRWKERKAEEWNDLYFGFGTDVTKKLIDSMLNEVIRMNGYSYVEKRYFFLIEISFLMYLLDNFGRWKILFF